MERGGKKRGLSLSPIPQFSYSPSILSSFNQDISACACTWRGRGCTHYTSYKRIFIEFTRFEMKLGKKVRLYIFKILIVFRLQIPSLLVNRCLQNAIDQQYMYSSQVTIKFSVRSFCISLLDPSNEVAKCDFISISFTTWLDSQS